MSQPLLSVSEFLDIVNMLLSTEDVFVYGEVTQASNHPKGMFFSIKDPENSGLMECYMSPWLYRKLGIILEPGMSVRVGGIASIYKPYGKFSFRVQELELAGEGSLKKAYDALKKKLSDEGLFDRKRTLPEFVRRIGLITSKTSAAIGDFRKNLSSHDIYVNYRDVRVEGEQAIGEVLSALEWFNSHSSDIDVVVMVRGGGSMESLQAFNDEQVVRAVFASHVPTLVSIGHERDVPLSQMVADASASTPTGAAQAVNDTWNRLSMIDISAQKIVHEYGSILQSVYADVSSYAHRLDTFLMRISSTAEHISQKLGNALDRIRQRIIFIREVVNRHEKQLHGANPEHLLQLGYSIVTDDAGNIVSKTSQLRVGQLITARLAKGSFVSEVKDLNLNK